MNKLISPEPTERNVVRVSDEVVVWVNQLTNAIRVLINAIHESAAPEDLKQWEIKHMEQLLEALIADIAAQAVAEKRLSRITLECASNSRSSRPATTPPGQP